MSQKDDTVRILADNITREKLSLPESATKREANELHENINQKRDFRSTFKDGQLVVKRVFRD